MSVYISFAQCLHVFSSLCWIRPPTHFLPCILCFLNINGLILFSHCDKSLLVGKQSGKRPFMAVSFYENKFQGFVSNLSAVFFMIGLLISYLFSLIILSSFAVSPSSFRHLIYSELKFEKSFSQGSLDRQNQRGVCVCTY